MATLTHIAIAPVQGFALRHPDEIEIDTHGIVENRRFFLVDGSGTRLRSSRTTWPCRVSGDYDPAQETLVATFPGGVTVAGSVAPTGQRVDVECDGRVVPGCVVPGPWDEHLERLAGHPVRLVRSDVPGARMDAPLTLVSQASLDRFEREAGLPLDPRRFRITLTIDGPSGHEEDTWDGSALRVGDAMLRLDGPIPRCALTTRHPDTGERDLDTLGLIKSYRGLGAGGTIDFGMYALVERPGRIRVGDTVALV